MTMRFLTGLACTATLLGAALPLNALEVSGTAAVQARVFTNSPQLPFQHGNSYSFSIQPEFYHEWADGDHSFTLTPFARYDGDDPERTHFDLREAMWLWVGDEFEFRAGIGKVFWGVAESNHLVDIINQTDFVEDIDSEEKLGQPMVNLNWIQDWGTVELYMLPTFRERTFAGRRGRPSFVPYVEHELVQFDSSDEEGHIDAAIRYTGSFDFDMGYLDLGVYHFWGTSREPRYQLVINAPDSVALRPIYDIIHQTAVHAQLTSEDWIWKLEAFHRSGQLDSFFATVFGFEYTVGGIWDTNADLGIVAEYHYDERDSTLLPFGPADLPALLASPQLPGLLASTFTVPLFDSDIMFGVRMSLNNAASTEALLGMVLDVNNQSTFVSLEGSHRLTDRFSVELDGRFFTNVDNRDPLRFYEDDSYWQLQLSYYF